VDSCNWTVLSRAEWGLWHEPRALTCRLWPCLPKSPARPLISGLAFLWAHTSKSFPVCGIFCRWEVSYRASPSLLEQLRLDAAEHMGCCTKRQVFEQRKVWGWSPGVLRWLIAEANRCGGCGSGPPRLYPVGATSFHLPTQLA